VAKYSEDLESIALKSLLFGSTRLIWVFTIPMIIGSWLFGDQLILWFFGAQYAQAFGFLKPLSLATGLFFLGLPPMVTILISHKMKLMIKIAGINVAVSFLSAFTALYFQRPDLLPWAMVLAQGFFLVHTWLPFKNFAIVSSEDFKMLFLPGMAMALALAILPLGPVYRFVFSASVYVAGLAALKIWRRPWLLSLQEVSHANG
jgi:O-antigen/teichoic acid export membrane protein